MLLGPVGQGKLWEVIEMTAMVSVACILPIFCGKKHQLVHWTAYSAVGFLSGKMAYGATRGLLQHAELFSTMTDRFIGGAVALLVASYVGKKFIDLGQDNLSTITHLESLGQSAFIALLGVGLRELAWAGVKLAIPFKA